MDGGGDMIIEGKAKVEIAASGKYCGVCPYSRYRKEHNHCDLYFVKLQVRCGKVERCVSCLKDFKHLTESEVGK